MSTLGGNVATNAGGLHGLKYGNTGGYVLGVRPCSPTARYPGRRAAAQGRRRVRSRPAAHRFGGHPRGAHRAHPRPAAVAGDEYHRPGLLRGPRIGQRSRARSDRRGRPARHPGVPRRPLHPRRRGLRPSGPGHAGRRAAAVRRRRQSRRSRAHRGDHGPGDARARRRQCARGHGRRRVRSAARRPALRAAGPVPARWGDDARGRRRATFPAAGTGAPHRRDRRAARRPDRHLRARRGRKRAPHRLLRSADERGRDRVAAAFADIFAAAIELGGTITGEHGVGAAKLPFLAAQLGAPHHALLARIKHAFDPAGILNPGKLGSS